MFDAQDLADLYAELGVPATYQPASGPSVAGRVVLALPGSLALGDDVVVTEPTVRYAASVFPGVARNGTFTIGGVSWRVRQDPMPLTDDAERIAPVERI
jgi:hypothetical protein